LLGFLAQSLLFFSSCFAVTQLAHQLQQERTQVVCTNKEAWKRLTEPNGTPAIGLRHMNIVLKINKYYFYVLCDDCSFEVDIRNGLTWFQQHARPCCAAKRQCV